MRENSTITISHSLPKFKIININKQINLNKLKLKDKPSHETFLYVFYQHELVWHNALYFTTLITQ